LTSLCDPEQPCNRTAKVLSITPHVPPSSKPLVPCLHSHGALSRTCMCTSHQTSCLGIFSMWLALPWGSPAPNQLGGALAIFPTGIKPIMAEHQQPEQWRHGCGFLVVGPRNPMCSRCDHWIKADGSHGAVLGKGRRRCWRNEGVWQVTD
jgi:hypothetical protein